MVKLVMVRLSILLAIMCLFTGLVLIGQAQGPPSETEGKRDVGYAFTYQGFLVKDGEPVNGFYEFQFGLYNSLAGGSPVGGSLQKSASVVNGFFSVVLDFGMDVFEGDSRYIQLQVRPEGNTGPYVSLTPRQHLTAVPHAIYAEQVLWADIVNIPAEIADGDDNAMYEAGFGLVLSDTQFSVTTDTVQLLIQSCPQDTALAGVNVDGSPVCESIAAAIADITAVIAGTGLSGGGATGAVTLGLVFTGTGSADTVSYGDHTHTADDFTGLVPTVTWAISTTAVAWANLTNVPTPFADNVDNDTTYSAGAGLILNGTTLSLIAGGTASNFLTAADGTPAQAVYVDNAGNTGIGSTTPQADVHVQGNGSGSNFVHIAQGNLVDVLLLSLTDQVGVGNVPQARLDVAGDIRLSETLYYSDLSDFKLVYRDDFETSVNGWFATNTGEVAITSTIAGSTILGGYGVIGNGELFKDFDLSTIPHTEVRVRFTYYALDAWEPVDDVTSGDLAYAYLSDNTTIMPGYWKKSIDFNDHGRIDVGGESEADGAYEVVLSTSHNGATLRVIAGGDMSSGNLVDETFGIDNVEIWIR